MAHYTAQFPQITETNIEKNSGYVNLQIKYQVQILLNCVIIVPNANLVQHWTFGLTYQKTSKLNSNSDKGKVIPLSNTPCGCMEVVKVTHYDLGCAACVEVEDIMTEM